MDVFEQIIDEFTLECKLKKLGGNTISTYQKTWSRFIDTMNPKELCDINKLTLKQYTRQLMESPLSDHTVNNYLRHVRAIINWMANDDQEMIQPFKIPLIKADTQVKDIFTDKELQLILKKPLKTDSFVTWRCWLASNILNCTGMRGISMTRLKWEDVDMKVQTIDLHKTKSKSMVIPISNNLLKAFMVYRRQFDITPSHYIIGTGEGESILMRTLQKTMNDYHLSRGIETNSLHQYRRTLITGALARGVDSIKVARMVGNSVKMIDRHYFGNQVEFLRDVAE